MMVNAGLKMEDRMGDLRSQKQDAQARSTFPFETWERICDEVVLKSKTKAVGWKRTRKSIAQRRRSRPPSSYEGSTLR